jgi:hypothetical protein
MLSQCLVLFRGMSAISLRIHSEAVVGIGAISELLPMPNVRLCPITMFPIPHHSLISKNLASKHENSVCQIGNTLTRGFRYSLLTYDLLVTTTAQYRSYYKN